MWISILILYHVSVPSTPILGDKLSAGVATEVSKHPDVKERTRLLNSLGDILPKQPAAALSVSEKDEHECDWGMNSFD